MNPNVGVFLWMTCRGIIIHRIIWVLVILPGANVVEEMSILSAFTKYYRIDDVFVVVSWCSNCGNHWWISVGYSRSHMKKMWGDRHFSCQKRLPVKLWIGLVDCWNCRFSRLFFLNHYVASLSYKSNRCTQLVLLWNITCRLFVHWMGYSKRDVAIR